MTTTLHYLGAPLCYEIGATVTEIVQRGARTTIVLDATIFYPQGGGQPCDVGTIRGRTLVFEVDSVTQADGRVLHEGCVLDGTADAGDAVSLSIDIKRRHTNSARHSGGHLLLNAMRDAGQTLVATKGYHFPDGPYVEFAGPVPETERDSLRERLQREVDRLISLDLPIIATMVEPSLDRPTRVVTIDGFSQPCGGTHVRSTGELSGLRVEKIKSKKGDTRVSYAIEGT